MKIKTKEIKTKEDLNDILGNLRKLSVDIYKVNIFDDESYLKQNYTYGFANFMQEDKSSPQQIDASIKDLMTRLQDVSVLELQVAFKPSQRVLDTIYDWATQTINENIVLDISTDTSLIGGAIVSYKGVYKNYSVIKQLNTLNFREMYNNLTQPAHESNI